MLARREDAYLNYVTRYAYSEMMGVLTRGEDLSVQDFQWIYRI